MVAAVLNVLRTSGYRAVTIDGIARDVKRARTSIYRRWPNKRDLVVYAVVTELGDNPAPDTGSLRRDLELAVETLWNAFSGPLGQAMAGLVGEMGQNSDLSAVIKQQVLAPRPQSMAAAFERARERGEIQDELDMELLLDMLTGPFYFRALFKHAAITRRAISDVVEYVLRIVAGQPNPGHLRSGPIAKRRPRS